MNQDEFIAAIKKVVHDSVIEGMKANLASPPGRNPHFKLKKTSEWYNSLSSTDKGQIAEIIRQTVHASVFGFLCVLDGVQTIESTPDKGDIGLTFTKYGQTDLLNDPQKEMLHDIYQLQVQSEVFEE